MREVVQTLSHNWKILLRDDPELRFKTPHIKNQEKSMHRETEKQSLIRLTIGGKQTRGPSPGERSEGILSKMVMEW